MSSAYGQKILLTCIVCVSVISHVNVIMGWWSPDNVVSTRIQIRQDEAGRAKSFNSYNEKEFSPHKGGSSQRDHLIGGHPTNVSFKTLNRCSFETKKRTRVLAVVSSKYNHFEVREAHRKSFDNSMLQRLGMRRIFVLGNPPDIENVEVEDRIEAENFRNGDLIRGDFIDSYHNLTTKHILALRYFKDYCKNTRYLIKMDDDIGVDYVDMLSWLPKLTNRMNGGIVGMVHYRLPVQRAPGWKWRLSPREFSPQVFPNFVSGWAYLTSKKAVKRILAAATQDKMPLWIDDVWVTGVLAAKAGVDLIPTNQHYTVRTEHLKCCLLNTDPNSRCSFTVAPTDYSLHLIELYYSRLSNCIRHRTRCSRVNLESNCTVENPYFLPDTPGIGEVLQEY